MIDVSYRYKASSLTGCKAMMDPNTGVIEMYRSEDDGSPPIPGYEKLEVFSKVPAGEEPLPVTAEEEEAFKAFGMTIADEEQFVASAKPVKPTRKRKANEGDK